MKTIIQSIAFMLVISALIGGCKKETMNTDPVVPTVTTNAVSSITTTTAVSGGNVTADGGTPVTAKGICWDVNPAPTTTLTTKTNDGTDEGSFVSSISGLTAGTTYYVRAYATNAKGTAYGNQVVFTADGGALATVTTNSVSAVTAQSAQGGGVVLTDGGVPITQRGICWSTSAFPTITSDPVLNIGSGTGNFSGTMSGLQSNTTYFVRAFATNAAGTAYGSSVSFTTAIAGPSYPPGTMHCMGTATAVVDVTNPTTGKIWMDRNLGAIQKATSSTDADSYGDLYQWGRRADLHQCRNSMTTTTLSSSDQPAHGSFIITSGSPTDWRSPQNINLWQGVNGVNNPCPIGYRIPTETELNAERTSWSMNNTAGAFASPLKLPAAGRRNRSSGLMEDVNTGGYYWSSTINGSTTLYSGFYNNGASLSTTFRSFGSSVRCIKN